MRYGYVRVSTKGQNTARQDVLMGELGVDHVFVDKCSGKNTERPQFHEMMSLLKGGDTVVVESYSRMSRSTKDLLETVEALNEMGVGFVSKKENIDNISILKIKQIAQYHAIYEDNEDGYRHNGKQNADI